MELNQLIEKVLNELEVSKKHEQKKKYLVGEVILELNMTTESIGGVNVFGINVSGTENNTHKMIVKLVPKKTSMISKPVKQPVNNK